MGRGEDRKRGRKGGWASCGTRTGGVSTVMCASHGQRRKLNSHRTAFGRVAPASGHHLSQLQYAGARTECHEESATSMCYARAQRSRTYYQCNMSSARSTRWSVDGLRKGDTTHQRLEPSLQLLVYDSVPQQGRIQGLPRGDSVCRDVVSS